MIKIITAEERKLMTIEKQMAHRLELAGAEYVATST